MKKNHKGVLGGKPPEGKFHHSLNIWGGGGTGGILDHNFRYRNTFIYLQFSFAVIFQLLVLAINYTFNIQHKKAK